MNFEDKILEQTNTERAYERAEKLAKKWRIRESEFADPYGEDVVQSDKQKVQNIRNKFGEKSEVKREADVFEVIIFHQAELQNWLGPEAHTILPSEYDDLVNGVDCLVEFSRDEGVRHLALAVDVTFSSDVSVVEEKIKRIESEIKKGGLTEVKYFQSDQMGYKGKLHDLPRVVVGADRSTVRELTELWVAKDNPALQGHFVRSLILEEIRIQLRTFKDYAEELGKDRAAKSYDRVLRIIDGIIEDGPALDLDIAREKDIVFRTLERMLK